MKDYAKKGSSIWLSLLKRASEIEKKLTGSKDDNPAAVKKLAVKLYRSKRDDEEQMDRPDNVLPCEFELQQKPRKRFKCMHLSNAQKVEIVHKVLVKKYK